MRRVLKFRPRPEEIEGQGKPGYSVQNESEFPSSCGRRPAVKFVAVSRGGSLTRARQNKQPEVWIPVGLQSQPDRRFQGSYISI